MRAIICIFILFIATSMSAQSKNNLEPNENIKEGLSTFFNCVSMMNDEDGASPSTIAKAYGGEWFQYNNNEIEFTKYLNYYKQTKLRNYNVQHQFIVSKITHNEGNNYTVIGKMIRTFDPMSQEQISEYSDNYDCKIMVVYDPKSSKELTINQLKYKDPLEKSPVTISSLNRYTFYLYKDNANKSLSESKTSTIKHSGGEWSFNVNSTKEHINYLSNGKKESKGPQNIAFNVKQTNAAYNQRGNTITGKIPYNNTFSRKEFSFELIQEESGYIIQHTFIQEGKPRKWWQEENDDSALTFSLHSGIKYPIGIGFTYRFDMSPFSLGFMFSSSLGFLHQFKHMGGVLGTSLSVSASAESYTTSGDIKTVSSSVNLDDMTYSSIVDPNNEAKHYDQNFVCLVTPSYHINVFSFEIGIGIAHHNDRYHLKNAYKLTEINQYNIQTGEHISGPEYQYTSSEESHCFSGNGKLYFASKIGCGIFIPLDYFRENGLSIGIGYIYVPGSSKLCSPDFSIGYKFNI